MLEITLRDVRVSQLSYIKLQGTCVQTAQKYFKVSQNPKSYMLSHRTDDV